jgi:tRNA(fMet)-specific endonuclease VapC
VKYVLDTNAVSALMKGDASVAARLRNVNRSEVAIPQPVIAEIAYGIARLPRSGHRQRLLERFELVCAEFARAQWTDAVSGRFGAIKATLEVRQGRRVEDFDAAIAAHALVADATLVTANRDGMAKIPGLKTEDWARP